MHQSIEEIIREQFPEMEIVDVVNTKIDVSNLLEGPSLEKLRKLYKDLEVVKIKKNKEFKTVAVSRSRGIVGVQEKK